MKMRTLGATGIKVSPLCLGAMMFGKAGNPDHDDSIAVIHRALDAGINFIDTADVYSAGESEEIVGKALAGGRRDGVVLATKFHGSMGQDPNHSGNSRRWIVQEVENSLRRLQTDHIDLYQVHRPDPATDIDETLGALTDLVRQGKIRAFGSSTFPAHEIVEAQWVAETRGRERFRCEQPPYSIFVRSIEKDVLPTCQKYGMGVIPWSPLAGGWLSGKYRRGMEQPTTGRAARAPERFDLSRPGNQKKLEVIEELDKLAADAGIPLIHLALAFVLNHPAVSAAIIGPRTMEQLEGQLAAPEVRLDDAVLDRIDELVAPGTNLNAADGGYQPPSITSAWRRRRPR
ncbi:MAG TPA: aldo/keto reductase [Acidimicrobiales bacterium]|nr:aldo/keto reductase [Acidimicrobiales bacterium]